MKITRVRAIPMSAPVPLERQHRTDLGTKVKSDAAIPAAYLVTPLFISTKHSLGG
jgi:hypothetical protein